MFINLHTHQQTDDICIVNTLPPQLHNYKLFSCGIHPWHVQNSIADFDILSQKVVLQNCLAIGECGLDKMYMHTWQTQVDIFGKQIKLANQIYKPIIIHCVKASNEIIKMMNEANNKMPVVIHGFNQNKNILQQFLQQNYCISIGAAVLQQNSNAQKCIESIPIERLFLETDNDDAYSIQMIYDKVAFLKKMTSPNLQTQIETNFNTIFANR
jgi:TatD DNase family protein